MPVYVAILRGINVSGHKPVKMEHLRALFEALGFAEAKTYIQSGNVIFEAASGSDKSLAAKIAKSIQVELGFEVPVLIRSAKELKAILKGNPMAKQKGIDESKLHVTFLSETAPGLAEETLKPLAAEPERFLVSGREIYLYCPNGYGRTKLSNTEIEKKLKLTATTRSWRTAGILLGMAGEPRDAVP